MEDLKEIVRPFYTESLTVNPNSNPATTMDRLLADDFQSIGSIDVKGKTELMGQIQFMRKLVPDLKWEVQEMLQEGNTVVVRSIASGTPNGDFMGLTTDGSKAFKIMTIDIHTVKDGKIKQVKHVEDWVVAMKQLQG